MEMSGFATWKSVCKGMVKWYYKLSLYKEPLKVRILFLFDFNGMYGSEVVKVFSIFINPLTAKLTASLN